MTAVTIELPGERDSEAAIHFATFLELLLYWKHPSTTHKGHRARDHWLHLISIYSFVHNKITLFIFSTRHSSRQAGF
jgi:hypothetical protein